MATPFTESIEVDLPALFTIIGAQSDIETATQAIDTAITMVETISGVMFRAEDRDINLNRSDAAWLRRAALFQAVWIMEQGDALTRLGASSVSQDGLSISVPDEMAFVLAPMAKRALQNCSWTKNSTLKVSTAADRVRGDITVSDEHPWTPMGVK